MRRGKRLKKHPGSYHRRTDAPHRSLIRSARGCAVLAAPEALTQQKAGGQELMVKLFGPSGRHLPVQKGAHFGLADIESLRQGFDIVAISRDGRLQITPIQGDGRESARCATRREVGMRGNLHRLYRQAMSRWGVASVGCNAGVKELAPERYW